MIKYLGSKRTLLPAILDVVRRFADVRSVLDLFSGTSRVGHALKREGYRVLANDHNAYAHALATCYVQTDLEDIETDALRLIEEFNRLPGKAGYFTQRFCVESRYLMPKNGERVDAIREAIAAKGLEPELEAVLLVSLMEAADRVDSTTGVQMAYLKNWAPRAHNQLKLRLPAVLPRAANGKGEAHALDALEAAALLEADLAYIDPPYNQHSYLGNYHVWESLILWDKPAAYGVARKRLDCKERRSAFNSKQGIHEAMQRVIEAVRAKVLLVSFSNEGYISRAEMQAYLSQRGEVQVIERDYKRYVGAQIGIHNPRGEKVGEVGHVRNKELLYLVASDEILA